MMREALTFRLVHPKSARGKAADRARHPVAIKIERHESRRPDVGLDVHLHAVDHGAKILAPQAERMNSPSEALQRRIWRPQAGVERVDIAPPYGERLPAGMTRPRFVRDVIDGAAEGIDFKHRLAARARKNSHRRIEGAAARARGRLGRRRLAGRAAHSLPTGVAATCRGRKNASKPSASPMPDQARALGLPK